MVYESVERGVEGGILMWLVRSTTSTMPTFKRLALLPSSAYLGV